MDFSNKTKLKIVPMVDTNKLKIQTIVGTLRSLEKKENLRDVTVIYSLKEHEKFETCCMSTLSWTERTYVFLRHVQVMTK